MSILVSDFKFSKRKVVEFLKLFYGLKLSLGTVSNNEARVSEALETSYDLLSKAAKKESNLNADETRHYENNKIHWAWIATNGNLTVLMLDPSRGKKAARRLLG